MELTTLQIELFQSLGGLVITLALGAAIVGAVALVVKYTPLNRLF